MLYRTLAPVISPREATFIKAIKLIPNIYLRNDPVLLLLVR